MRQSGRDPAPTPPRTQTWGVRATAPGRPTPAPLLLANAWGVHATNRPRPPPRHPLARKRGVCVQQRPAAPPRRPSRSQTRGECMRQTGRDPRPDTPLHSNAGCACNSARPRPPTSPRTQTWGACNSAQPRPPTPDAPSHANAGGACKQRLPATPPRHPLARKRVGGVCDILCTIFLLDSYLVSVVSNVSGHLNHLIVIIVILFFSTYTSMSDGFGPACHLRKPKSGQNQSRGRVGPLTALTK